MLHLCSHPTRYLIRSKSRVLGRGKMVQGTCVAVRAMCFLLRTSKGSRCVHGALVQAVALRVISRSDDLFIRLEDQEAGACTMCYLDTSPPVANDGDINENSRPCAAGELFAECPLPNDGTPLTVVRMCFCASTAGRNAAMASNSWQVLTGGASTHSQPLACPAPAPSTLSMLWPAI